MIAMLDLTPIQSLGDIETFLTAADVFTLEPRCSRSRGAATSLRREKHTSAREAFLSAPWARSAFTGLLQSRAMHFVYVLESKSTKQWYIGYTTNVEQRLDAHNEGKNGSTSHSGPWKLIYYEAYLEKMDALGREKFLKSGAGHRFVRKQLSHYFHV